MANYPVRLELLNIGVRNYGEFRDMAESDKKDYFYNKIIPGVYREVNIKETLKALRNIDYKIDIDTANDAVFDDDVLYMRCLISFKNKSDYLLWKMAFKSDVGVLLDD